MSYLQPDGTLNLKIIAPGHGSTAYYSSEVLKRDGPKVFTKGLHMHMDHPTVSEARERPERSITTIGGVLEEAARWLDHGPEGPGLYAKARPIGAMKDVIEDLAPHIGVSIRASGLGRERVIEGRKNVVLESLTGAQSIDFVTVPGAGGRIVQLFESARQALTEASKPAPVAEKPKGAPAMADEFDATVMQEAQRLQAEELRQLKESNARLQEAMALRDAEDVIRRELDHAEIHSLLKARIASEAIKNLPLTDVGTVNQEKLIEQVHEAVQREAALYTAVTGGGRIHGMGSSDNAGYPEDQVKAAQARLEESFKRQGMQPEAAALAAAGRR